MRRRWQWRWWELAPEAATAAALLFFLVDETDAATSAGTSGRAVALTAGTAAAWLTARVLAARFVRPAALRLAAFVVPAAVVVSVVVLPAYDDETVTETLAVAAGSPSTTTSPATSTSSTTTSTVSATPSPTTAPTAAATSSTTTAPPAEPVAVARGELRGIDHRASGQAVLYRRPDGGHVVGLEDFDIQPGPDYDLYVVPGRDRQDRDGGTRLGDLRGNRGTQYDDVPADVSIGEGDWTVLVWCHTFAVPIANATLA